jgi:DNA repair exonuclease SbcCD ATPase subunit
MKNYILIFASASLLFSCNAPTSEGTGTPEENEELARLQSENRVLQSQLAEKDSMMNEAIMLFNEIEENLAMINLKDDEIRFRSTNVELAEDGKQWILQEIQNINYLREENQKKIDELNKSLKHKNLQIEQFQTMVNNLMNQIAVQEEEIEMLRLELGDLDREYVELLEAYQEQSTLTAETLRELNKAFYSYGTEEELVANGVIVKQSGFIGINKQISLKNDFNDDYFTQIDMTQEKMIQVTGKKFRFVTDHPSTAYRVESAGQNHKIIIEDPKSFWKVSNYLVVVVD